MLVWVFGICSKTCSKSNTMYGDQQSTNTITITMVILTVFTLAFGMIPRELARLRASSALPFRKRSEKGARCNQSNLIFKMYQSKLEMSWKKNSTYVSHQPDPTSNPLTKWSWWLSHNKPRWWRLVSQTARWPPNTCTVATAVRPPGLSNIEVDLLSRKKENTGKGRKNRLRG